MPGDSTESSETKGFSIEARVAAGIVLCLAMTGTSRGDSSSRREF
jgi:hypothetical protein